MPIDTDSTDWQEGDEPPYVESQIVEFLASNQGQAFRLREIADAVSETDWKVVEEYEQARDELPAEELEEEYPPEGDHPTAFSNFRPTDKIHLMLRDLGKQDIIESRRVDADAFEDAYLPNQETAMAYSYGGIHPDDIDDRQ